MGSACGIELGPASCVLVSARAGAAGTEVGGVHIVGPGAWPGKATATIAMLKAARRAQRFPRRARVVAWELEQPASVSDAAARAAIKPIVAAGFRVEAVLTPPQALAAVAASRRRPNEGPIAWLAVNTHGAAIAIVRGTEILYSRTLRWADVAAGQSVKEQLLQRYSLVSHIAPHLQHGLEQVRVSHGARVETVVTCGNLPDLRSLTMPLIEELDLEVETLDSAEGLVARGAAAQDRFLESAPAIRLACAAAIAPLPRGAFRIPAGVAALVVLGVIAYGVYRTLDRAPVLPVDARLEARRGQPPSLTPAAAPPVAAATPAAAPPPAAEPKQAETVTTEVAPPDPAKPAVLEAEAPRSQPLPPKPAARPAGPTGRTAAPEKKGGQPLPPVPPLTSILIDSGRRFAMIGGAIVEVGDRVGPRVVVRIDADAVVLRDPSGAEITVLLRRAGADAVKSVPFPEIGPAPSAAP